MTPIDFHLAMMALYSRFPFRETSGQRSPKPNSLPEIGGVANNYHQVWLARDFILDDMSLETKNACIEEGARHGLQLLDEGDYLHAEPLPVPPVRLSVHAP